MVNKAEDGQYILCTAGCTIIIYFCVSKYFIGVQIWAEERGLLRLAFQDRDHLHHRLSLVTSPVELSTDLREVSQSMEKASAY